MSTKTRARNKQNETHKKKENIMKTVNLSEAKRMLLHGSKGHTR